MDNNEFVHVNVSMNMVIDKSYLEKLKNIIDHHIDWLIDLDSNEEIRSVYNAEIKEIDR